MKGRRVTESEREFPGQVGAYECEALMPVGVGAGGEKSKTSFPSFYVGFAVGVYIPTYTGADPCLSYHEYARPPTVDLPPSV